MVIAGNHDLTMDLEHYDELRVRFHHGDKFDARALKAELMSACTYLEDEAVTISGVKFYGSPWQPEFYEWAFNLPRGPPCSAVWERVSVRSMFCSFPLQTG